MGNMSKAEADNICMEIAKTHSSSTSFVLCVSQGTMRSYTGQPNYAFYPRFNQPCYGELRKYRDTHGKDATQARPAKKPTDLHHPFPDGKPECCSFPFGTAWARPEVSEFVSGFFTDDNPWIRGFGSSKNISLIMKGGNVHGFHLLRLNVDPTVLVNLLWFLRDVANWIGVSAFNSLISEGATKNEAYAILMMNQFQVSYLNSRTDHHAYHYGHMFDSEKFFAGKSNDLTGGTLEDRWDYNRKDIHDVFRADHPDKKYLWTPVMSSILKVSAGYFQTGKFTTKELLTAAREYFDSHKTTQKTSGVIEDLKPKRVYKPRVKKDLAA